MGSPRGVVANVLDSDMVVSEFKLLARYHFHFRTYTLERSTNLLIFPCIGKIVSLLFSKNLYLQYNVS